LNRFSLVIGPLHQLTTASITNPFVLRRVKVNMVHRMTPATAPAARQTTQNVLMRQGDIDHLIKRECFLLEHTCQFFSLPDCSRKAVKHETVGAGQPAQFVFDKANNHFVWNQLSPIHARFGLHAKRGSVPNSLTEDIARGNL
jgi:hypothetical protein